MQNHFHFSRFLFLPCKIPVLKKEAHASANDRIHMLELALKDRQSFKIDTREIVRKTPSFMVETLESFRAEFGNEVSITLCLGMDAFLQLPKWYCYEKILDLSHLLVLNRSEINNQFIPKTIESLLLNHQTLDKNLILQKSFGTIVQFDAGNYPIASSEIRKEIALGHSVENWLPHSVYQFILKNGLYTSNS